VHDVDMTEYVYIYLKLVKKYESFVLTPSVIYFLTDIQIKFFYNRASRWHDRICLYVFNLIFFYNHAWRWHDRICLYIFKIEFSDNCAWSWHDAICIYVIKLNSMTTMHNYDMTKYVYMYLYW